MQGKPAFFADWNQLGYFVQSFAIFWGGRKTGARSRNHPQISQMAPESSWAFCICANPRNLWILFHRHGLCQIARLIDVAAAQHGAESTDLCFCGPRLFGLVMERPNWCARTGGHSKAVDPAKRDR